MNPIRHVALLRGINVGGNNIIRMVDLRASFEAMGFTEVQTYIQSSNVVFSSKQAQKSKLVGAIETTLARTFRYSARIVLISSPELETVVAEAPSGFGKQPARYRYDVLFVKEPLTAQAALPQIAARPGVDAIHSGTHALYYRRLVSKAAQSQLNKLAQQSIYQSITIRNWNTTTRLLAMASPAR